MYLKRRQTRWAGLVLPLWMAGVSVAQSSSPAALPAPAQTPGDVQEAPGGVSHGGQIVIQSHGEPPPLAEDGAPPGVPAQPETLQPAPGAVADVTDVQREALTVTSYDLDARLDIAKSNLQARARLRVRNDSSGPLSVLPLQISSSLRWETATLVGDRSRTALPLAQHRIDTDADHTGAATELVLSLPTPLPQGGTLELDLFYAGSLAESGARLARLGATPAQQHAADWDGVAPGWTGLRGFGEVLWYPVSSPQLFLAEGNSLMTATGRLRRREQNAQTRLHLAVQYAGEPPVAAYFCGRRVALKAVPDDPDVATAAGAGIATADFPAEPLGFRAPSLFVLWQPEQFLGGGDAAGEAAAATPPRFSSSSENPGSAAAGSQTNARDLPAAAAPDAGATQTSGRPPFVALVSSDAGVAAGLGLAADEAGALLRAWLGPRPLSALTVLDHAGQPFQDGPLLVAPAASLETSPERPALVYSLSHAWVQTGQPWMDEGLAQFFALLWVERNSGRAAALAEMTELLQPVALAEPNVTAAGDSAAGQPLVDATDELFYRRKAAAIWWMLREIVGEPALREVLTPWREQPASQATAAEQALALESLLEKRSGKDLHAFFQDWVLRDRGLPDLSIVNVEQSPTAAGPTHDAGWLIAVTVHNDGGAIAYVPIRVRSGQVVNAGRIQVPAFETRTERILVQAPASEVVVNDGSVPELRTSTHTRQLAAPPVQ